MNLNEFIQQANFYKPYRDHTGKIEFIRYCNNGLSYGKNSETRKFYLCESPELECVIIRITGEYKKFDEARTAFFKQRYDDKN